MLFRGRAWGGTEGHARAPQPGLGRLCVSEAVTVSVKESDGHPTRTQTEHRGSAQGIAHTGFLPPRALRHLWGPWGTQGQDLTSLPRPQQPPPPLQTTATTTTKSPNPRGTPFSMGRGRKRLGVGHLTVLSQETLPLREGGFGCHRPGGEQKFPGLWVGRLPWAPVPHPVRPTEPGLRSGWRRGAGGRGDFGATCPQSPSTGRSPSAGHTHGESRKPPYPCSVFDLVDPQLHGHVKAVKDVSAEHQRVYGGVDRMDPAWGGGEAEGQPHTRGPGPHTGRGQRALGAALERAQAGSRPHHRRRRLRPVQVGWWTADRPPLPPSRTLMTAAAACCFRPGRGSQPRGRTCPPTMLETNPSRRLLRRRPRV